MPTDNDKTDYVLVYDGQGGVRMAPAGSETESLGEPNLSWPPPGDAAPAPEALQIPAATVTRPRRLDGPTVVVALAICGLVLGAGLFVGPKLAAPLPADADAPVSGDQMKVMVLSPPTPAVTPPSGKRLDVLPAGQPVVAAATTPSVPAAALSPRPSPAVPILPVKAAPQPAPVMSEPVEQADAQPDRAPVRDLADCGRAHSRAEAMVCADPELAQDDRRLRRAFRAAARSGTPFAQLRAEQDDWLDIREDAALRSRRAVAQVYAQRIEELEALADSDPR